jgi:hypothetical protein
LLPPPPPNNQQHRTPPGLHRVQYSVHARSSSLAGAGCCQPLGLGGA